MKQIGIIIAFLVLFVGIIVTLASQFNKSTSPFKQDTQGIKLNEEVTQVEENEDMKKPKLSIDKTKKYTAVIKTSVGDIEIELFADKTPLTVNNFVSLSKKKFYENVIFHRTMKGFMIQGGDPTGTGSGGPGYRIEDELSDGNYTRGTLAMANTGSPNTGGSQFFIMHADVPLPKTYTIFGMVIKGLDVVDTIAEAPTKQEGEGSTPINPVKIISIEISER